MHIKKALNLMKNVGEDLKYWQNKEDLQKVSYKKGKEIVSYLDLRAEKKIIKGLKRIYPSHKIWGEEHGKTSKNLNQEKYLLIDPIDGSKNYLTETPLYASQLACIEFGHIKWGIINLPSLGEIYWAIKGKGAFRNGRKIVPSKQNNLTLSTQCFGLGHDAENIIKLPKMLGKTLAEPRQYGCAGLHFAYTASGKIDIYIAREAGYYDIASGILLCKEAGLKISDLNGNPHDQKESSLGLVIANTHLMKQYQKIVKKVNLD